MLRKCLLENYFQCPPKGQDQHKCCPYISNVLIFIQAGSAFTKPLRSGMTVFSAYTTMAAFPKCHIPIIIRTELHILKNNVRLKSESMCVQISKLNTSGKLFLSLREVFTSKSLIQLDCLIGGIAEKRSMSDKYGSVNVIVQ